MKKEIVVGVITTVLGGLLLVFFQNRIFTTNDEAIRVVEPKVTDCEKVKIKGMNKIEKMVLRQVANHYNIPENEFCYDFLLGVSEEKKKREKPYERKPGDIIITESEAEILFKDMLAPKFEQDLEEILDIYLDTDYPITLKEFITEVEKAKNE